MTLHFDTNSLEFFHPKNPKRTGWRIVTVLIAIGLVSYVSHSTIKIKEHHKIPQKKYDTIEIMVTSYQPTAAQCDSDPFITASGEMIPQDYQSLRWAAVSTDLLDRYLNFNDSVIIITENEHVMLGKFRIMDKMAQRKTKSIDILYDKPLKLKAKMLIYP